MSPNGYGNALVEILKHRETYYFLIYSSLMYIKPLIKRINKDEAYNFISDNNYKFIPITNAR